MKSICLIVWGLLALSVNPAARGDDATPKAPAPAPAKEPTKEPPKIRGKLERVAFISSKRGPLDTRSAIGGRSSGEPVPNIWIMAPSSHGVASIDKPTVFWAQDKDSNAIVEITIVRLHKNQDGTFTDGDLVARAIFDQPRKAGIHRLDATAYSQPLKPDVQYKIKLTIRKQGAEQVEDWTSAGLLYHKPQEELVGSDPVSMSVAYMKSGYWYDGFGSMMKAVEQDPTSAEVLAWRFAPIVEAMKLTDEDLARITDLKKREAARANREQLRRALIPDQRE